MHVALSLAFALGTPAWETNDERDHANYTEYMLRHHSVPPIPAGPGIEWHQPPLYYASGAVWQRLWGVHPFTATTHTLIRAPGQGSSSWLLRDQRYSVLILNHRYDAAGHYAAVAVRYLRLLSVLMGAALIVVCYCISALLFSAKGAAAVTATVALWPRLVVLDGSYNNDVLTNLLCATTVLLVLLWWRRQSWLLAVAAGLSGGAAALTKYTALPIVALALVGLLAGGWRRRRWHAPLLSVVAFALVTAWWWIRNQSMYGDPLASTASRDYLAHEFPKLVRPPGTLGLVDAWHAASRGLVDSVWYRGGWNQLGLPHWLALALTAAAVTAVAMAASDRSMRLRNVVLLGCAVGSLLAWLGVVEQTTGAEGRYLLVGAVGWAGLFVSGTRRLAQSDAALWLWPAVFGALDVALVATYLLPFGRL